MMPFIDDSASFVNGFEVGQLWASFKMGDVPESSTVHTANVEQLRLVAEHYRYDMFVEPTEISEWTQLTFKKKTKPTLRLIK